MLSVIILTFNSNKFIKSCLDSVFSQYLEGTEIIVVDNASKDGTVNFIKENYPQVILIENKENLGAAQARNQGIGVVQGDWILTLDCDVILGADFLKTTRAFIRNLNNNTGMFQPKILNIDRKTIYSCGIYLSRLRRFYDIGKGKPDGEKFNAARYIFGACSAAAFYKRKMLEEIKEATGYFDERFFFLVEDVDLSWRAQNKGWKAIFYPNVACYHYGNSSGYDTKLRQYLCWKNRKMFLKKCKLNILRLFIILFFYDLPHQVLLFLTNSHVRNEPDIKRCPGIIKN